MPFSLICVTPLSPKAVALKEDNGDDARDWRMFLFTCGFFILPHVLPLAALE